MLNLWRKVDSLITYHILLIWSFDLPQNAFYSFSVIFRWDTLKCLAIDFDKLGVGLSVWIYALSDLYCLKDSQIANLPAHELRIYEISFLVVGFDTPNIMILSLRELFCKFIDVVGKLFKQSFGLILCFECREQFFGDILDVFADLILIFCFEPHNRVGYFRRRMFDQKKATIYPIILNSSDMLTVLSISSESTNNIFILELLDNCSFFNDLENFLKQNDFGFWRRSSKGLNANVVLA